MAITSALIKAYPDTKTAVVDLTLDATSYAAGGIPLTNAQLNCIQAPDSVDAEFSTGQGFAPNWVPSTSKLIIFKNAAGAGAFTECVAADFSTAMKVRLTVVGLPIL